MTRTRPGARPQLLRIALAVLFAAAALSGCLSPPEDTAPPVRYLLSQLPEPLAERSAHGAKPVLVVAEPVPAPALEGRGMAYITDPPGIGYYRDSQWAAPPAQMLTPLLLETFQATGAVTATRPGVPRYPDYRLHTELLALHHRAPPGSPGELVLKVHAVLTDAGGQETRQWQVELTQPVDNRNAEGAARAANEAVARALGRLREGVLGVIAR